MKLEIVVSLKMRSVFNMRCLEHRQCAEGVFLPSHTVTCVLLSASGTEWEIRILFLIKFYSGKKF